MYLRISALVLVFSLFFVTACKKESQIPISGCTYTNAINFNPDATVDDGSCVFDTTGGNGGGNGGGGGGGPISGCTNPKGTNYNANATVDDGSCIIPGCTDPKAENYDPEATEDDGSCIDVREKFVGDWDVTHDCTAPFSPSNAMTISYDSQEADSITISNFLQFFGGDMRGIVNNKVDVDIPSQTAGLYTIDGAGYMNSTSDQITLNVNYSSFFGSGTCTLVFKP